MYTFKKGLIDGIPVCLGYFAVAPAIGISAVGSGMDWWQALLMSLGMVASAGEYAAITLISTNSGIIEMMLTTIVVNMRYFLMSCSLTQKAEKDYGIVKKAITAFFVTDEIFGIESSVKGRLNIFYSLGLGIISVLGWCLGTLLGAFLGSVLPEIIVSSLALSLYGMFLAIIVPKAKADNFTAGIIIVSMLLSGIWKILPIIKNINEGFKIIILTIVLSSIAAVIKPIQEEK